MVELREDLDRTFAALADPTRRAILAQLRSGPATVGELARPFRMSLNGVSKHIRTLERAGLVLRDVRGREHRMRLQPAPLRDAVSWADAYRVFWERRLDALDTHLQREPTAAPVSETP